MAPAKPSFRTLATMAVLAIAVFYLGKSFLAVDRSAAMLAVDNPEGVTPAQALGTFTVSDSSGANIPIVVPGEPAIIMVSSTSCGWCKRTLKEVGQMANGRDVPRLRLLTLEGAAEGAPMLAKEGIKGATMIGPSGPNEQVLMTFRFRGTPTFLAVNSKGRVVQTMPGYPGENELKRWFAVMIGDSEVP